MLGEFVEYSAPSWAQAVQCKPRRKLRLAHLPTPLHALRVPGAPSGWETFVKRDDMTGGLETGGNKIRKLEFLLAEALEAGADVVVTAGGMQSNHCRATVSAARMLGLRCVILLRIDDEGQDPAADPGVHGNLMVGRLCGAELHVVSRETYRRLGGFGPLLEHFAAELRSQGSRPYVVPLGGSNGLGTWGYLQAIEELREQCAALPGGDITDIALATGSGGTAVGLALGAKLSGWGVRVHGFGVNDQPAWHYAHADATVLKELLPEGAPKCSELMEVTQAKGPGYAQTTPELLKWLQGAAEATGLLLDPCYSGKALKGLAEKMRASPGAFAGRRVLFVHTGGGLGMLAHPERMLPLCPPARELEGVPQPGL
eukprot:TRINITY_DN60971_c0_g1_i1.p2 TRINITY_DN60971_c0_g1~~TRINITY_DN60971_c0_g1_i1.p2  ORF type:complete len:394 (+),score=132.74 TRINITY_DN60971_c0_g1_i1:72-1184(+)